MKIVIISDIHDNLVNLKKCLKQCSDNKIEKLICCGDVTNPETLKVLASSFIGDIFLVAGNIELWHEEELDLYKNIKFFGKTGVVKIGEKNIGICHEPFLINKVLKQKVDIVFYGHTHKPWIEVKNKIKIINPGTLGGVFTPATFAVWDTGTKEPELKLVEELNN